jgi:hypothetical protein
LTRAWAIGLGVMMHLGGSLDAYALDGHRRITQHAHGLGNLRMSSNRGIWRVSRQQLEARAAGLRATIYSVVYSEADGMRDREGNGANDPASWRTRDDRLWLPTGKEVVTELAHLHTSKLPNAVITGARVDREPQRARGRGRR